MMAAMTSDRKNETYQHFPPHSSSPFISASIRLYPDSTSFILLLDLYEHSPASETGDVDSHLLTPQ